jgi:anti-sigma factor RsiW
MITHDEASELLGAYALDAVDGEEHTRLEEHLEQCPRCRAELDGLREVAAALGNSVEPLPEGLWSNIASRLPERPDAEAPPMPRLTSVEGSRPSGGANPRLRGAVTTIGAIAVAAAAIAAVLGIGLVHANDKVSNLQAQVAAQSHQPSQIAAALAVPGHRVVELESPGHTPLAQFVVVPDGRGYLMSSTLPTLARGRTYQLWGIVGITPISLGLMGRAPGQVTFTLAGSARASELAITAEPMGGSVAPTSAIVASGSA